MGGLFSRAYKRITQGNNQQTTKSDRQESDQQHSDSSATRDAKRPARSLVESIPVGQSIDSAEYRALEGNKNVLCIQQQQQQQRQQQQQQQQQQQKAADSDKENNLIRKKVDENEKKKDVEEAVIKIQALVRGHLTRKALKDANQPANGQLGQSQFDEESLTKTPLSAIFSPSSLINTVGELRLSQQPELQINPASAILRDTQQQNIDNRLPLESIAEVVETTAASIGASVQQTAKELADYIKEQQNKATAETLAATSAADEKEEQERQNNNNTNREKLASICQSHSGNNNNKQISLDGLSGRTSSLSGRSDSSAVSPVPSEANASIDLNTCDTPASASIDILDHYIRPADRLAAVLHIQQQQQQQQQQQRLDTNVADTNTTNSGYQTQIPVQVTTTTATTNIDDDEICTPDSLDSNEEAAAIRIQSAFRGYRTRKNSPYRTRSPNSINGNNNNNNNNKRDALLRQQEAVIVNDDDNDDLNDESKRRLSGESADGEEELEASKKQRAAHKEGRRESRSKQRGDIDIDGGGGGEFLPASKESTIVDSISGEGEGPSLDLGLSEVADTAPVQLVSSSAALEDPSASASSSLAQQPQQSNDQCLATTTTTTKPCKTSIGSGVKLIETSSFDTDSSVLGAALSLDDEQSTSGGGGGGLFTSGENGPNTKQATLTTTLEESPSSDAADEVTIELESEARRLVEELENDDEKDQHRSCQDDHDRQEEDLLDEATNQLEAALDEAMDADADDDLDQNQNYETAMDEEKQLAIELESDDIERRDPRGQASEERARSPQISTESMEQQPIEFVLAASNDDMKEEANDENDENDQDHEMNKDDDEQQNPNDESTEEANVEEEIVGSTESGGQLMVENTIDSHNISGRSSPAFEGSSNGEDSDDEATMKQEQEQQSTQPTNRNSPSSGAQNKSKKRNRNKKRGKK